MREVRSVGPLVVRFEMTVGSLRMEGWGLDCVGGYEIDWKWADWMRVRRARLMARLTEMGVRLKFAAMVPVRLPWRDWVSMAFCWS